MSFFPRLIASQKRSYPESLLQSLWDRRSLSIGWGTETVWQEANWLDRESL